MDEAERRTILRNMVKVFADVVSAAPSEADMRATVMEHIEKLYDWLDGVDQ